MACVLFRDIQSPATQPQSKALTVHDDAALRNAGVEPTIIEDACEPFLHDSAASSCEWLRIRLLYDSYSG